MPLICPPYNSASFVVQRIDPRSQIGRNAALQMSAAELSQSDNKPVPSAFKKIKKGRRIMASMDLGSLPLGNPCAQCGKPIVAPEWVEDGPGRTSYLWHCWACDYTFEAVAFFDESQQDNQALAA
jgi:hypothetical protein